MLEINPEYHSLMPVWFIKYMKQSIHYLDSLFYYFNVRRRLFFPLFISKKIKSCSRKIGAVNDWETEMGANSEQIRKGN